MNHAIKVEPIRFPQKIIRECLVVRADVGIEKEECMDILLPVKSAT